MRALAVAAVALCGCQLSWTFDSEKPPIDVIGDAPQLDQFPRLNHNPVKESYIVDGADGNPWLVLCEVPYCNAGNKTFRVVPLIGSGNEFSVGGTHLTTDIRYYDFYTEFIDDVPGATQPSTVSIVRAGEAAPVTYVHPPGDAFIFIDDDPNDPAYVYWVKSSETRTYEVVHKNGMRFTMPVPSGSDPANPESTVSFTLLSGARVLVQDAKGDTHLRSMKDPTLDEDLGMTPQNFVFADAMDAIVGISPKDGITVTPLGGKPYTLDPTPASTSVLWLVNFKGNLYWCSSPKCYAVYITADGELRRTRLDGKEPPITIRAGVARLIDFTVDGREIWGAVSPDTYVGGVGDGNIGDWHFMDRGWGPQLTVDGKQVLWVDDAAKPGNIGDLFLRTIDSTDAPLELAKNVRHFDEMADGRVLAVDNHATNSVESRVVIIDPASRTAQWVAPSANDYGFIPKSPDLLVDIITGATGVDVRRVPIPPKM